MNTNKHPFIKNVLTLMSGTAIAQLLSIIASPLLSRIFTPEDFALLASFTSVTSLCVIACSGKYEQAILLPESEEESRHILRSSIVLCIFICLILPFIILFVGKFNAAFNDIVLNGLIPVTIIFIFCSGICEILRVNFLRNKQFKAISSRTVVVSLTTVSLNLLCGRFLYSKKIFVTSTTIAQIISLALFFVLFFKLYGKNKVPYNIKEIKRVFIKYRQFPIYNMTGQILNSLSANIPILVLANYYSANEIGLYAFVNKIVNVPISVVASAVSQAFLQKFIKTEEKNLLKMYVKTASILFIIIILPALLCAVFAVPLFGFVFGDKWKGAGEIAQVLTPMLVIRFALNPIEGAVSIAQMKQYVTFIMQITRFVCVILSIIVSVHFNFTFNITIFFYSLGLIIFYLLFFIWEIIMIKKGQNGTR